MKRHTVLAIIIDNKTVLLQKRRDFRLWAFPGGKVEAGELSADAAIRETQEETGLIVRTEKLVADIRFPQVNEVTG